MSRHSRSGVTLIELLVVIAIIVILISLVMAGISALKGKEGLTTTQTEVRGLKVALENFKTKFGIYPPSQITIGPSPAAFPPAENSESERILKTMWPSLNFIAAFGVGTPTKTNCWNLTAPVTLQGDQCLVFFLGGYRDTTGPCMGFSPSKSNPFEPPVSGTDREQPFFKFKPERLFKRVSSSPLYSYGDGFFGDSGGVQTCYAYFAPVRQVGYVDTHCKSVVDVKGNNPQPYKDGAGVYLSKQSFQIVSSGADLRWGNAFNWVSGTGIVDPPAPAAPPTNKGDSADNITDFANGMLSGS